MTADRTLSKPASDPDRSLAAVRRAVRLAVAEHKLRGEAVVVREGGRIKWVPADEIVVPDDDPA